MRRSCGDCVACCTYLRVSELEKPGLTACPHATMPEQPNGKLVYIGASKDGNCRLHGTPRKPSPCRDYACLWLAGYGEEEDRPDRCGVLIDTLKPIPNSIQCKPLWEGAQDSPAGVRAIERMSRERNQPALVAGFPETQMVRVVGRGAA